MAFMLILSFAGVMTWITRRIEKLTHRITEFSEEVSYDPMEEVRGKDKLAILENRFQSLMKGVTHSQAIIKSMFSSYVSPKVVEELLANPEKAKLGAQRKKVTILFADLVGFTRLSEKLDPEEVVALLNDFFNAMTDIIIKWDGTIDKIVGDEIMAFWGAPVETPNHAELAVRCALHMTKAMQELRNKWEAAGRTALDCGIGIHTGEVLVGNIGAEGRIMDYTIIGDPVNTAARVENLTRQYQANILLTESTFKHIQPLIESGDIRRIELIERGFVKVKGRDKDVHIYELSEK
jgi:adenylate cyclase